MVAFGPRARNPNSVPRSVDSSVHRFTLICATSPTDSRFVNGVFMDRVMALLAASGFALTALGLHGQSGGQRLELDRKGETIVLEPYAPNILRVTLSLQHDPAVAQPGYGFIGAPDVSGWTASETDRADVYQSSSIVATVERPNPSARPRLQTEVDIRKYFNGSTPGAHITFTTPGGKRLLEMTGWSQAVPNHKDGTASLANDRRSSDPEFYVVGATFASPDDEH